MRVTLGIATRLQAHAGEQVARPCHGGRARQAVHLRAEGDAVLDGQPRVQAGVAVLEHHLRLAAEVLQAQVARAHGRAVEDDLAGVGVDELHQQPRGGALAATAFADHAQGLTGHDAEVHAIHRAHHAAARAAACAEEAFLQREVLDQAVHRQQRCRTHCLISIAERRPSDSRLNAIEVKKIITPGSAAIQG